MLNRQLLSGAHDVARPVPGRVCVRDARGAGIMSRGHVLPDRLIVDQFPVRSRVLLQCRLVCGQYNGVRAWCMVPGWFHGSDGRWFVHGRLLLRSRFIVQGASAVRCGLLLPCWLVCVYWYVEK